MAATIQPSRAQDKEVTVRFITVLTVARGDGREQRELGVSVSVRFGGVGFMRGMRVVGFFTCQFNYKG